MNKNCFEAILEKNKIVFKHPSILKSYLSGLKEGQELYIWIKKKKKIRTTGKIDETSNQNGYYWSVIIPLLSDYLGYLPAEMHEAIKYTFLRKGNEKNDLPRIGSTSELDTEEWEDLMEKIRIWALTEFGIKIPLPNEDEEDFFNNN